MRYGDATMITVLCVSVVVDNYFQDDDTTDGYPQNFGLRLGLDLVCVGDERLSLPAANDSARTRAESLVPPTPRFG